MKDTPKGVKKYEGILKQICNIEDLSYLYGKEWEGCLGVAMVLSYMEGVAPTLQLLGKHLGISSYNPQFTLAFNRLKTNGVFGNRFNVKEDPFLKGEEVEDTPYVSAKHMSELCWSQIAGIAGGFTGIQDYSIEK